MKKILSPFLFLFAFCFSGFGQVDSSAVVREVDSLINLSTKLSWQQKYIEALQVVEAAESKARQFFGEDNSLFAACLNAHYGIFLKMERFADAESLAIRACAIWRKTLGDLHPDYAGSLMNLATIYRFTDRYEKAEKIFEEAVIVFEKGGNLNHKNYAGCLNNMAGLYRMWGNFEKAEPLYLKSLAIRAALLGKESPDYAGSLINLSNLYRNLGDYNKAKQLLIEAKDIFEVKLNNRTHQYYTNGLVNLGLTYKDMGDSEKAETLFLEAKSIWDSLRGVNSPITFGVLLNLSAVYRDRGDYEKAEEYLNTCRTICENTWGRDSWEFSSVLSHLAFVYVLRKNYEKAEQFYHESTAIIEKTRGKKHPEYAHNLLALAYFYEKEFRYSEADSLSAEACALQQAHLVKSVAFLSERELSTYIKTFEHRNNGLLRAVTVRFVRNAESGNLPAVCFDQILFYKGFLLNAARRINALPESDTITVEKYNLLKYYLRSLAKEYSRPILKRDTATVTVLEEKVIALEKELARSIVGFGEALRQVNWQEVQATLKPDEAAIEFVRFQFYYPNPTDSTLYAALLLKPGMASPAFIGLFEEKQLNTLLASLSEQGSSGLNELYSGQAGQSVYQLLWAPLEPHLAGVKTVYYSPAGLLHRLNLNAIPSGKLDETIGKRHALSMLGSTRSLAGGTKARQLITATAPPFAFTRQNQDGGGEATAGKTATVFGGIRYDMDSTAIKADNPSGLASRNRGLSFSQTDSTLRGGAWEYLKYSEKEADNIQSLLQKAGFQTDVQKGYAATEEAFKQLGKDKPSPHILHISTHGFFFPDPQDNPPSVAIGLPQVTQSAIHNPQSEAPVFKISDHPMIRSGLILAGGNHAWKTGQPLGNREDGILTAYEISQLDLRNTDLVVLSACETGLGQIEGNEGVYGLQRAFKIAGAKNLVMSLWQVPDYQTQELMTAFYRNMLEGKMPVRQALHAAQEEMRQKRYEPYFWAGFVLVE
ncbi:MAG: hypothetical protein EPGJADBJ_00891 [Saprospiraceae bacterium]|nr:hypothetical protein [Saprospiraceae bacterium]